MHQILVVDDESDIQNLVRTLLEEEGYNVISASNGDEALIKANSEKPDLMLLDIVMPGKSGLEVCKILKTNENTKDIQIFMFTVLGRQVDRKLTNEAGADGHFTKPFSAFELKSIIESRLNEAKKSKFTKQLGTDYDELKGKKILFEFNPSSPYERLVRDYAIEFSSQGETVIVLTPNGSAIQHSLEGDEDINVIQLNNPYITITPILQDYKKGRLSLVYDNLTDLALSINPKTAYKFSRESLRLLSDPDISALFLFNPSAQEPRDVSSIRGLFKSQIIYGEQGIRGIMIK